MGNIQIVLHAHLPFIRHPEHKSFLEENWLFEAISESYTPLIQMIQRLDAEGINPGLTISISPSLMTMLGDKLLLERYVFYLQSRIELGEKEVDRTAHDSRFSPLASMYLNIFKQNLKAFIEDFQQDILKTLWQLQKKGCIEIITTPGTSPFLPFYEQYPANIYTHVETAIECYHAAFREDVRGMWLSGGGYYSGLEEIFKELRLEFFYLNANGILLAEDCPPTGIQTPVKTLNELVVFARDPELVGRVWSDVDGYPGDFSYRDFHRDIGHDLDFEYIRPYVHQEEFRMNTGYKYYAITGETDQKQPYLPEQAGKISLEHAKHFVYLLQERVHNASEDILVTTPFSAELFGHWWFEGVQWLESVIRIIAQDESGLHLVTPSAWMANHSVQHRVQPVFSSWGEGKGYAEVLLNGQNDWIYRHLHSSIERMQELAHRFPKAHGLNRRALNQAAREVLLAQTMDWPFIMRSGVSEEYARTRIREHIGNFYQLYDSLGSGNLQTGWLIHLEEKNNIFPYIDYFNFATGKTPLPHY